MEKRVDHILEISEQVVLMINVFYWDTVKVVFTE